VLAPHWSFPGREGQPIEVRAFSNASEVELFLNGRSLGKQLIERHGHAAWRVPYEPGTLSATGYVDGHARLAARVETTSAPTQLRLTADRTTIAADGRDLAVVTISVVDREGRAVPTSDATVGFEVAGGGRILGVGNGDPSSHEPDRIRPPARWSRRLFNGLAQLLLQSNGEASPIRLTATAPGLAPAELTVVGAPP
jgi:beta-galactosidase